MSEKWIQDVHMKKGALHAELGVPEGQKIPKDKLAKAASKGGKVGKRARFAEELEGFHKSPSLDGLKRISDAAHDKEAQD